ncbi:hypothetical protein EX30DRAFT_348906 [Ascodesmis nigricans]|uniref:Uncharacterized protein n=1 Tax=Ascodesmis nigricans TaxID=341454 RepID=A0A4S2MWR9_9PEZI|nr:hypothetical protein EX30DRAFT_348906 [Ascodesmis nigricans]
MSMMPSLGGGTVVEAINCWASRYRLFAISVISTLVIVIAIIRAVIIPASSLVRILASPTASSSLRQFNKLTYLPKPRDFVDHGPGYPAPPPYELSASKGHVEMGGLNGEMRRWCDVIRDETLTVVSVRGKSSISASTAEYNMTSYNP